MRSSKNIFPAGKTLLKEPQSALTSYDRVCATRQASVTQIPNGLSQSVIDRQVSCEPTLLETIRDTRDPQQLRFLQWRHGHATVVARLEQNGKLSAPPESEFDALSELRLPDRILPCGSPREMLADLRSAISKFVDLAEEDVFLVSLYILSSWFPDCLKSVPYLWLVGPLGSGKSTLLKFLHCVCRRALLIGDVRPASLYKFASISCPTLLLDELEPDNSRIGAEVRRLLRIGNVQGIPAARNGRLFQTFGPKVISSRQPPLDVALASRAITVRLLPTEKDLQPLHEVNIERVAREFQPPLLMFRCWNSEFVRNFEISFERLRGLTPRTRDLARGLAAPLLGETDLEDKLFAILREYDREARIERSLEPEWLVVEALFDLCHERSSSGGCGLLVGGLALHINQSLALRGENVSMTAKSAGGVLKSLGIQTHRLGNLGRGVTFTTFLKRKIHQLARRFGFDRTDLATLPGLEAGYGGVPCLLCEEIGVTGGLRFVDLEARPFRKLRRKRSILKSKDGDKLKDTPHSQTSNVKRQTTTRRNK